MPEDIGYNHQCNLIVDNVDILHIQLENVEDIIYLVTKLYNAKMATVNV